MTDHPGFATSMDAAAAAAAGLAAPSAPSVAQFTAPTGFAASASADLLSRARAYGSEHVTAWPGWVEPRVAVLSELAILIAGRGDRDPLVSSLAVAGQWKPGRHVEALVASILVVPQPRKEILAGEDNKREQEATSNLPNAAALLHQLCSAVVRDVVEDARQIRDRAAAELLAVQPDHRIEQLETRATKAELTASRAVAEAARAQRSEEVLLKASGLMRAELRWHADQVGMDPEDYLAGVLAASDEKSDEQPEESKGLPKGVRQKKQGGRYEALLYRADTVDGKQRSCGSYETVEEAVAARDAAIELERESVARGCPDRRGTSTAVPS